MAHEEKCDNCGEMKEITHEFFYNREGISESRRYRFCYECGKKIEEKLREGVN